MVKKLGKERMVDGEIDTASHIEGGNGNDYLGDAALRREKCGSWCAKCEGVRG